eukprot:7383432-Prymnesium_polylepis.1
MAVADTQNATTTSQRIRAPTCTALAVYPQPSPHGADKMATVRERGRTKPKQETKLVFWNFAQRSTEKKPCFRRKSSRSPRGQLTYQGTRTRANGGEPGGTAFAAHRATAGFK